MLVLGLDYFLITVVIKLGMVNKKGSFVKKKKKKDIVVSSTDIYIKCCEGWVNWPLPIMVCCQLL